MRKAAFAYAKTKPQTSFTVTVQLIRTFVFATYIEQSLHFQNPKFKSLAIFCGCTPLFVSDLVRNPEDRFSHDMAQIIIEFTGIVIKSNMEQSLQIQYAGIFHNLLNKTRNAVRDLDPQNDLTFLRIRTKKNEIMIAPGMVIIFFFFFFFLLIFLQQVRGRRTK